MSDEQETIIMGVEEAELKFGIPSVVTSVPKIIACGVGGAGCNAINNIIAKQIRGIIPLVVNTDVQPLESSMSENRIQIGPNITSGLGAGAIPEVWTSGCTGVHK